VKTVPVQCLYEESTRTEHVTLWNRSLLVTALERAGWRVLEVQNDDTAKYVDPNRRKMLQERAWLRAQAAIGRSAYISAICKKITA